MQYDEYSKLPGLTASTLKAYRDGKSLKRAKLQKPETEALRWGKIVHAALEFGQIPPIAAIMPDNFKDYRSKEARAWRDSQEMPLTRKEAADLRAIIHAVDKQLPETLRSVRSDFATLREQPIQATIHGIECKGLMDEVNETKSIIIDWKKVANIEPRRIWAQSYDLGYHIQAFHYFELAAMKWGKTPTMYFAFIEEKAPHELIVAEVTDEVLHQGEIEWMAAVERWKEYKETEPDDMPGFAGGQIIDMQLPSWAGESDDLALEEF